MDFLSAQEQAAGRHYDENVVEFATERRFAEDLSPERCEALRRYLVQWLRAHGPVHIGTDSSLFAACQRR